MLVGYARVSTLDQDLTIQVDQLTQHGAERVFSEKLSGTTTLKRDQLAECLAFCREGDVLLITRLDRIARSSVDLHNIVAGLEAKGVGFRCTAQSGVDTTTTHGKLMLGMLGAVAEFENGIRKERQLEGIARAKSQGIYKGRQPTIDPKAVAKLRAEGKGARAIAKELNCSPASVYRLM